MNSNAYKSGWNACYFGGVSFHANPYPVGTQAHEQWKQGWLDCEAAHYGD